METASTVSLNEAAAPHEASNFSGRSVILEQDLAKRLSTGVTQLDEIMRGGYVPRRSYMIRGDPGAGKTTVGLHFLVAGAAGGEMTLYITVGESEEQIHKDILRMPYLQSEKSDIR